MYYTFDIYFHLYQCISTSKIVIIWTGVYLSGELGSCRFLSKIENRVELVSALWIIITWVTITWWSNRVDSNIGYIQNLFESVEIILGKLRFYSIHHHHWKWKLRKPITAPTEYDEFEFFIFFVQMNRTSPINFVLLFDIIFVVKLIYTVQANQKSNWNEWFNRLPVFTGYSRVSLINCTQLHLLISVNFVFWFISFSIGKFHQRTFN